MNRQCVQRQREVQCVHRAGPVCVYVGVCGGGLRELAGGGGAFTCCEEARGERLTLHGRGQRWVSCSMDWKPIQDAAKSSGGGMDKYRKGKQLPP